MELRNDLTIGKMFAESAARWPQRRALVCMGQAWTYEELDALTDKVALGMRKIGIRKGSRAALWASDRPNLLFCFLALEKIGAVPVMCNTSWTGRETGAWIRDRKAEYLFCDEGYKNVDFLKACGEFDAPQLKCRIYIGPEECARPGATEYLFEDLLRLGDEAGRELPDEEFEQAGPSDVDMILFTSGSTGAPKGVVTTHYSRANLACEQARMVGADCHDVFCVAIPMYHCFSMTGNVLAALAAGACVCFPQSRRSDHVMAAIEQNRCTILTAVPTVYSILLANPRRSRYDLSSLRIGLIGGSGCSHTLFDRVCRELGMELLPSLGQTEATAGITAGRPEDSLSVRASGSGYLIEHIEGKTVDLSTGETLQYVCGGDIRLQVPEKAGEFCVRGYIVMQGYDMQPELTCEAIDADGFLHTGDMGWFDAQGNLHLTGRLKELIIRGGENIAPGEVEEVLLTDRRITAAKVIGVPDEHYGEVVCACIECADGVEILVDEDSAVAEELSGETQRTADKALSGEAQRTADKALSGETQRTADKALSGSAKTPEAGSPPGDMRTSAVRQVSAAELRSLAAESLASYKVPKYIFFFRRLPLTGSGKIDVAFLKKYAEAHV